MDRIDPEERIAFSNNLRRIRYAAEEALAELDTADTVTERFTLAIERLVDAAELVVDAARTISARTPAEKPQPRKDTA